MTVEAEGTANFTISGSEHSFRFKISVSSKTVRIWLEDRGSKEQWQTNALVMDDFVTPKNTLTQAKLGDYAKQFVECLAADSATTKTLSATSDSGKRKLQLYLALGAASFAVTLVYEFQLEQVPLERVDIVAAQMRDAMDAIEAMQATITQMQKTITTLQNPGRFGRY